MTEAMSFGANGCCESCQCDQEFWTYHQQNKGRITNLIINQTKMTKIRDLIEKIWWVIPPIIMVFGIPLYDALDNTIRYSHSVNYIDFLMVPEIFISWGFLGGGILIIFTFGFMGIGYYFVRKKISLALRIIVPSILGIIGFYAGHFALLIIGGLFFGLE
jgi:cbb3-type cytochrome oxidase subunit 1